MLQKHPTRPTRTASQPNRNFRARPQNPNVALRPSRWPLMAPDRKTQHAQHSPTLKLGSTESIYIYICTRISNIYTYRYACTCIYLCAHVYMYIYICIYLYKKHTCVLMTTLNNIPRLRIFQEEIFPGSPCRPPVAELATREARAKDATALRVQGGLGLGLL